MGSCTFSYLPRGRLGRFCRMGSARPVISGLPGGGAAADQEAADRPWNAGRDDGVRSTRFRSKNHLSPSGQAPGGFSGRSGHGYRAARDDLTHALPRQVEDVHGFSGPPVRRRPAGRARRWIDEVHRDRAAAGQSGSTTPGQRRRTGDTTGSVSRLRWSGARRRARRAGGGTAASRAGGRAVVPQPS